MKTNTRIVVLILLCLAFSTLCLSQEEKGIVFPGQSLTLLGIKIKWIVPESEKTDSEKMGTLEIIGPRKQTKIFISDFNQLIITRDGRANSIFMYIDEVILKIDVSFSGNRPVRAEIVARSQGCVRNIENIYCNFGMVVSSLCPISINEWRVSYSEDKIPLADGSQYYMISAVNEETKEKVDIPVMQGSFKKAGCFTINIRIITDEPFKTQMLNINAEPDMTIRGKDAYIEEFALSIDRDNPRTETIQYFLETLAAKYGFEIKWDEYPGHPESVDVMKNLPSRLSERTIMSKQNLSDLVDEFLKNKGVIAKWETSTILHLNYQDYDKEIKKREEEKQDAKLLQTKTEEFHRDYAIETKAYQFNTISAETAKSLITPELNNYILYRRTVSGSSGFHIGSAPTEDQFNRLIEKVQETAVADEKTNTLILSAIPKTHEKFQEMIQKIDAILKKSETPISVKPFKISLSLFQGTKTANLDDNARTQKKQELLKQAEQYGINKDDISLLDFDTLELIGKGFTLLYPEKGEIGKTVVSLGKGISCTLEFLDLRQPYLIVRTSLNLKDDTIDATLIESTLYLVSEKPTTLGITDLKGAYILVVKMEKSQ